MGRIDILGIPREMVGVKQQGVKQATSSPLGWTSIIEGQVRIGGTAILLVDSSGGIVVHGTITGDGTITWTGVFNLSGSLNVTGTETVMAGGKIVVNGVDVMTIGVTSLGSLPGLQFASGGAVMGGSGSVYIASAGGANGITVGTATIQLVGKTVVQGALVNQFGTTTTSPANMFIDSSTGAISRITSARRFKIGPKLMKLAPSILDVRMKDWIDKGARKRGEPDVRVPGVIAEEVLASGGEAFITRGAKGEVEGVAYDRYAVARTQALNDKLDAALATIGAMQKQIDKLTA